MLRSLSRGGAGKDDSEDSSAPRRRFDRCGGGDRAGQRLVDVGNIVNASAQTGIVSIAQIEPIVAYKNEAFTLFQDLMNTIWSDFARMIYNVEVRIEGENGDQGAVPQQQRGNGRSALQYSGGTMEDQPSAYGDPSEEGPYEPSPVIQQRRVDENEQLGRNDPCWCGSGKKFQKCHGA